MSKKRKIFLWILSIFLLAILLVFLINPLRFPKSIIRQNILGNIPLGTTMDDAIQIIETKEDWKISHIDFKYGYQVDKNGRPGVSRGATIGKMYMQVHLGNYHNIFLTDVVAFLGFDNESKLIEVSIQKYVDAF